MNLAVLLVTAATILHASSGNPQFRRGGGWNPIPDETSSEVQGTVPKRPIFVTDTRSSILLLHSSIQRLSDNLGRHDTRVRQMSEQLRVVRDSQRSAEKSIESIAILLQRLDSRLGNMEAQMAAENNLVSGRSLAPAITTDEDSIKEELGKLSTAIETQVRRECGTRLELLENMMKSNCVKKDVESANPPKPTALQMPEELVSMLRTLEGSVGEGRTDIENWRDSQKEILENILGKTNDNEALLQKIEDSMLQVTAAMPTLYDVEKQARRMMNMTEMLQLQVTDVQEIVSYISEETFSMTKDALGQMVVDQGEDVKHTIQQRLDITKANLILKQQEFAEDLEEIMKDEVRNVWRQISLFYGQLQSAQDVLQSVNDQTQSYVNGSFEQVGSMNHTVGAVMQRLALVEENLNHLLGRLALAASQFSNMKMGLADEFDDIRLQIQDFTQRLNRVEQEEEKGGDLSENLSENLSPEEPQGATQDTAGDAETSEGTISLSEETPPTEAKGGTGDESELAIETSTMGFTSITAADE